MKSASANVNSVASNGDGGKEGAVERARRIEDCICSVITNVASWSSPSKEFSSSTSSALFSPTRINTDLGGALNSEFSSSTVSKHKSLAASLPSLSGVMVNTHLMSNPVAPPAAASSITISRTITSATTTTTARTSCQLHVIGDLPENVLETSCTPPSSPSKLLSTPQQQNPQNPQNSSSVPIFTALTPVNVQSDGGNAASTSGTTGMVTMNLLSPTIHDPNQSATSAINSSTAGAVFAANTTAAALTQLFPMATASSTITPMYLAVKVEPQEIEFSSASPSGGDNSATTCSASILSPLQFTLATGNALSSPTFTTLATVAGTGTTGSGIHGSTSSGNSNAEFLPLQPTAVYVQPIQQNGQMQYVRVELPANVSLCKAESSLSSSGGKPSSVSTVELAHNIIATMFPQQVNNAQANPTHAVEASEPFPVTVVNSSQQHENTVTCTTVPATIILTDQTIPRVPNMAGTRISVTQPTVNNATSNIVHPRTEITNPTPATAGVAQSQAAPATVASRKRTSTSSVQSRQHQSKDALGSMSGEEESEDIYIDTKELCNRIAYELKAYSIPQAVFAERVLCRSQGTLSDLLRNPKPWNKLKSGRETFRRMYVWLKQPLEERLTVLEMGKAAKRTSSTGEDLSEVAQPEASGGITSPEEVSSEDVSYRPDDPVATTSSQQLPSGNVDQQPSQRHQQQRMIKKPRLVFTDIQKRTLQAIFKETQRPSREMQQTIAEHLNLDLSTVQNFFMNARRRSRIEQPDGANDTPTPSQSIRPITPPPPGGQSVSPASVVKSKSRPRPRNRKSEKRKLNDDGSMADHASQSLAYSGGVESAEHGTITLPPLALHELDSANGGEEMESLLLEDADDDIEEEYMDDADAESQSDATDANMLHYGDAAIAEQSSGQTDGNTRDLQHIVAATTMVDAKPQL